MPLNPSNSFVMNLRNISLQTVYICTRSRNNTIVNTRNQASKRVFIVMVKRIPNPIDTRRKRKNIKRNHKMSHLMRKPTICICENKGADQLRGNREADHSFVFATRIVQFLYFLNPKFPVSSHLLCLYRPICVGPVRKPHYWFSPQGGSNV